MFEPVRQPQVAIDSILFSESAAPVGRGKNYWEISTLLAILVLAGGLRFWNLEQQGFGNGYYAAAVRSMLVSPSNFFFGSFDPVGLVTVDKPPVALWVQATSAQIFGYSGISILAPQGVIGLLTILAVYLQVRRLFGGSSALIAALVLAINPISIAVDRDNLPDPLLTLLLTVAAGALIRSTESASLRWLCVSVAIVGAAFNVKMLAAFVVLPAFYLTYFLAARTTWWGKTWQLSVATCLLAATSLSWSLVVDQTPPQLRPYIGGSTNNSAIELALGYNGLNRVFGGMPGASGRPAEATKGTQSRSAAPARRGQPAIGDGMLPGMGMGPPGIPGGFSPFGGPPGWLRFTGNQLAEQITWLLPIACFGALAIALSYGVHWPMSRQLAATILWTGWLATHLVVFSYAKGIFHDYYTVVMGPAIAVLVGAGLPALFSSFHRTDWQRSLLPTALLAAAAWQTHLIGGVAELRYQLLPIVVISTSVGILFLLTTHAFRSAQLSTFARAIGISLATVALMLGPAAWSLSTALSVGSSMLPAASASLFTGRKASMFPGPPDVSKTPDEIMPLVEYLRSERRGETYLVAGLGSMSVQSIIIHTGEPAVAIGGFMGADSVLTEENFIELVRRRKLRFMLLGGGPFGGGGPPFGGLSGVGFPFGATGPFSGGIPPIPGGMFPPGGPMGAGNSRIIAWVQKHGKKVDRDLWNESSDSPGVGDNILGMLSSFLPGSPGRAGPRGQELYDLSSATSEVAADALPLNDHSSDQ